MTTAAWLLALGLLVAGIEPQDEDWDWLSKHRSAAFDSLMPIKGDPRAWVTYFSYRDLYQDVHEAYFSIRAESYSLSPEALVIRPVDRSIQQQMLEMHMADRVMPFESVLERVKVRRQTLSGGSCPAVADALHRLARLRFGMPQRDVIVLHPTVHRVLVQFGGGDIDLSLYEDDHPLVQWAQRTLLDLERCPAAP